MKRFFPVLFSLASIALLLHSVAAPAAAHASQDVSSFSKTAVLEGQTGTGADLPIDSTAVTAQHYRPSPRPVPGALTPTERLYLPPALPKHLRRYLVNNMTQPGSHAVMFMQTAASAKVTSDSLVLEDVPIETVWFMNRPDRYVTGGLGWQPG